jgi:hypothetical protein
MNASVPAWVILIVLAGAGVLWLAWRWSRLREQSARRTFEALTANTAAVIQLREALAPAAEELRSNMAAVPKLLETVAKIGSAQLEIMQAQRAAAEAGRQPPAPPHRPNSPIAPRDTTAANLAYDVDQIMRAEGVTREEALMRLNGANEDSVWGGNLFQDWGRR